MIQKIADSLRNRQTTSLALINAALARIEQLNPSLNAFLTVLATAARQRASELDSELSQGTDRGPLHGVPVAVKDLIHMRGVPTTGGSPLFAGSVSDEDAECVKLLGQAGAVIVGKTGLHELAYGITSNNPHFGAVRNPCDIQRIPGGSSGGSGAAVGAGIVPMALGTDTGGSIRIPASFCGCVGLKPTFGLVSKRGVLPLGFSLDHIGPLSASVEDAAITLNVLGTRQQDYRPGKVAGLQGIRVGRPSNFYFDRLAPSVRARVDRSFELAASLGAEVIHLKVPDVEEWNAVARVVLLAEASAALEPHLSRRDQFAPDVLTLLDQGRLLPATLYVQAQRVRSRLVSEMDAVWNQVDCLFTATTPTTAPEIGATHIDVGGLSEDVRLATTRLVRGINLLGVPALSLPCGADPGGLPVGLQVIAPAFGEKQLLRIGSALECAGLNDG